MGFFLGRISDNIGYVFGKVLLIVVTIVVGFLLMLLNKVLATLLIFGLGITFILSFLAPMVAIGAFLLGLIILILSGLIITSTIIHTLFAIVLYITKPQEKRYYEVEETLDVWTWILFSHYEKKEPY